MATKLSVVMPVYNERATLREITAKYSPYRLISNCSASMMGSRDGSREILAELQERHPQLRVLSQPKNMSKGAALRRGIHEAKGDIEYPQLLEPLIQGKADVVYGSRFLGGQPTPRALLLALSWQLDSDLAVKLSDQRQSFRHGDVL
jgi:glycosyltransferase involved in cell wall biosynthesis